MKELSDSESWEINGGVAWIPMVLVPIGVGVAIGASNQYFGALVNNWDAFKKGFRETAV